MTVKLQVLMRNNGPLTLRVQWEVKDERKREK